MVPVTEPIISACCPLTSPSTTPLAPITTFAVQWMLPTRVPSIRRSPLLVISPFREVPAPMRLVLVPAGISPSISDFDFALNMVSDFNRLFFQVLEFLILLCPISLFCFPAKHFGDSGNTGLCTSSPALTNQYAFLVHGAP